MSNSDVSDSNNGSCARHPPLSSPSSCPLSLTTSAPPPCASHEASLLPPSAVAADVHGSALPANARGEQLVILISSACPSSFPPRALQLSQSRKAGNENYHTTPTPLRCQTRSSDVQDRERRWPPVGHSWGPTSRSNVPAKHPILLAEYWHGLRHHSYFHEDSFVIFIVACEV